MFIFVETVMVINSTKINNTNNYLSSLITELTANKKTMTSHIRNQGLVLGQAQKM
jgi:hypothetical protein